jgi:hypothetical protein
MIYRAVGEYFVKKLNVATCIEALIQVLGKSSQTMTIQAKDLIRRKKLLLNT